MTAPSLAVGNLEQQMPALNHGVGTIVPAALAAVRRRLMKRLKGQETVPCTCRCQFCGEGQVASGCLASVDRVFGHPRSPRQVCK